MFEDRTQGNRGKQNLTEIMHFAGTPEEKAWLRIEAYRQLISMSALIRRALREYRERREQEEKQCSSD